MVLPSTSPRANPSWLCLGGWNESLLTCASSLLICLWFDWISSSPSSRSSSLCCCWRICLVPRLCALTFSGRLRLRRLTSNKSCFMYLSNSVYTNKFSLEFPSICEWLVFLLSIFLILLLGWVIVYPGPNSITLIYYFIQLHTKIPWFYNQGP